MRVVDAPGPPSPPTRPGGEVVRSVRLRDERTETDRRVLDVFIAEDGSLCLDGHDLGPGTEHIRADGEYEWRWTIRSQFIPLVRAVAGCRPGEDLLTVLAERFRGPASYELEQRLRESEIPREFWSWP